MRHAAGDPSARGPGDRQPSRCSARERGGWPTSRAVGGRPEPGVGWRHLAALALPSHGPQPPLRGLARLALAISRPSNRSLESARRANPLLYQHFPRRPRRPAPPRSPNAISNFPQRRFNYSLCLLFSYSDSIFNSSGMGVARRAQAQEGCPRVSRFAFARSLAAELQNFSSFYCLFPFIFHSPSLFEGINEDISLSISNVCLRHHFFIELDPFE